MGRGLWLMAFNKYNYTLNFNHSNEKDVSTPSKAKDAKEALEALEEAKVWRYRKEVLETLNNAFNLVAKNATVLGGVFICLYALNEDFLPTLLSSITIPMLIILGSFSTFVFGTGIIIGSIACYSGFRLYIACRSLRKNESPLIPKGKWEEVSLLVFSVAIIMFLIYLTVLSSHRGSTSIIIIYFIICGFFTLKVLEVPRSNVWLKFTSVCVVSLLTLIVIPFFRPVLIERPMVLEGVMHFASGWRRV